MRLDARPSDSIALALKYKAPVYVAEEILKEAGYKVKIELEGTITLERMRRAEDEATEITATDMDMALAVEDLLEEVGEEGISFGEVDSVEGQISELQKMMDLAIREEHYEEASRLRDKIAKLRGEHKD
jgi:excinuclease UvrABC helicase subunit UvrB